MNIINFGAIPNNSSDCLPALKAAITAATTAPTTDCTIDFPPGKYSFSGPIVLPRGLRLCGAGLLQEGELGTVLVANYDEAVPDNGFITANGSTQYLGTGLVIEGLSILKGVNHHGGTALKLTGADDSHRTGRVILNRLFISAYGYAGTSASWDRCLLVDGMACTTTNSMGVRDVYVNDCEFAACTVNNIELRNAVHFYMTNSQVYPFNEATAAMLITGGAALNQQSQDVHLTGVSIYGTLTFDWAKLFTFQGYASALAVTANAQHGVIMGVGGQWTNNGTSVIMTGA